MLIQHTNAFACGILDGTKNTGTLFKACSHISVTDLIAGIVFSQKLTGEREAVMLKQKVL